MALSFSNLCFVVFFHTVTPFLGFKKTTVTIKKTKKISKLGLLSRYANNTYSAGC